MSRSRKWYKWNRNSSANSSACGQSRTSSSLLLSNLELSDTKSMSLKQEPSSDLCGRGQAGCINHTTLPYCMCESTIRQAIIMPTLERGGPPHHGGVRPFHRKSNCLTQSTSEPCAFQIWSKLEPPHPRGPPCGYHLTQCINKMA